FGTRRQRQMCIRDSHMGVGPDNLWWLEVLENGQCSPFARFFDIDWLPMKDELRGKVLLPVLGDRYGTVLERGQLKLAFDPERGAIEVRYYENRFPIDPKRYPEILSGDLESLRDRLGPQDASLPEFESLIGAFHHLPDRWRSDREAVLERTRDKEIHKRKLAELARRVPEIRAHVEAAVARVNGEPGKAESFERLHRLLEEQTYRLAYWRVATDEINYRRFFDVNELAGLRMEVPEVFDLTHRRILQWIGEGKIQGLRIDHPDGLRDPAAYFARLQARAAGRDPDAGGREAPEVEARAERGTRAEGGTSATAPLGAMAPASGRPSPSLYLVIEKILGSREQLREDWEVHGTTGYEFLNLANGLFVLPEAERAMDRIYARFLGRRPDFGEILYQSKKLIMRTALASELVVLANLLDRISESDRMTRDFTLNTLQEAIVETVACFPVYRTYVTSERVTPEDRRYVDWAIAQAKRRSPASDLTIFDFLRDVLLLEPSAGRDGDDRQARVDFAMKFQQYTAPVMAKGLEDTSFYRYHRLISLNEVGGDPRRFSTSPGVLHRANFERLRRWPHSMLSSSTHDSKRSEDVRARTNVLTELPEEWRKRLAVFSRLNRSRKMLIEGDPAPDRNDEYLLYQTLVGAWPLEAMGEGGPDDQALAAFRERIIQYMQKAIKEAKVHTSWINPNAEYEQATTKFVTAMLRRETGERFLSEIVPFARKISWFGMYNALSQTLLKALSPGVPDFYQGSVVWDFTLVDPDNRRPVDYEQRRRMIDELREVSAAADRPEGAAALARSLLDTLEDGRAKQYLILRCLSLRKERPALFQAGAYLSLDPRGDRENHLFAFARHDGEDWAIVIAPRFFSILLEGQRKLPLGDAVYGETWILLPPEAPGGPLRNLFTGEAVEIRTLPDGTRAVGAGSALVDFPVAVLTSPRRLEA
ncbi:MAG: malto-oligosyltrehalose synthase, partial [Candidatus Eisenbacteria bacterium]|nr:malto-oligosyltrehalose synthase [Candidatus Eisenbacteria bacterium]